MKRAQTTCRLGAPPIIIDALSGPSQGPVTLNPLARDLRAALGPRRDPLFLLLPRESMSIFGAREKEGGLQTRGEIWDMLLYILINGGWFDREFFEKEGNI